MAGTAGFRRRRGVHATQLETYQDYTRKASDPGSVVKQHASMRSECKERPVESQAVRNGLST